MRLVISGHAGWCPQSLKAGYRFWVHFVWDGTVGPFPSCLGSSVATLGNTRNHYWCFKLFCFSLFLFYMLCQSWKLNQKVFLLCSNNLSSPGFDCTLFIRYIRNSESHPAAVGVEATPLPLWGYL